MKLSRRTMLFGGAAAIGAGGAGVAALNARNPDQAIAAMVRRIFGADIAQDDVLRRFAAASAQRLSGIGLGRGVVETLVTASYPMLAPILEHWPMPSAMEPIGTPYENAASTIATLFIRYTDYQIRAPGAAVTFDGFPDMQPFMCLNMIARYDDDD